MKWRNRRASQNIEDRRGRRVATSAKGGIGALAIVLIAMYFGVDPRVALQLAGGLTPDPVQTEPSAYRPSAEEAELADFVAVVLADTEDTWQILFRQMGQPYQEPKLVLFNDSVRSACGAAQSAMGPFYCPADSKVYIDLSFYRDLKNRHQAPGDFAQAYVIAHEVGHHVQHLLGISDQVHQAQQSVNRAQANALSVKLELQADCLAGLSAHHTEKAKRILEAGDVEEALNAASAIGDDRLQRQARGYVTPESFTHGTSAQRVHWFKQGLTGGDLSACNTFKS